MAWVDCGREQTFKRLYYEIILGGAVLLDQQSDRRVWRAAEHPDRVWSEPEKKEFVDDPWLTDQI